MKKAFCFILNPLELIGELPFEVIPGHFLQKADPQQTALIKEQLARYCAHSLILPAYEYDWLEETGDGRGGNSRRSQWIPEDKWRYWVITFDGPNTHIHELQLALSLLEHDLDFGSIWLFSKEGESHGMITGDRTAFTYFDPQAYPKGNGALQISTGELSSVNGYFQLIKDCEKNRPHIYRALGEFYYLKALPRKSNMVVLGCFAVIEALTTHDPQEDYDSLNHQISTKMALLSKRFERRLDYGGHFGLVDREKIWKKLYGYRSALAHGTSADFKNDLKLLKDHANALDFLKEAAKLTLLFAMKDPEFLADLKKC